MGARLGRFELGDEIARGRRSVVYSGQVGPASPVPSATTGRVAIKVVYARLGEPRREALVSVARAAAGVQHRNVVKTLDVVEGSDAAGWAMELLDGIPLSRVDPALMTTGVALRLVGDALAGLHEVHRKLVCPAHVDAEHVMLTRDGRVKVLLSRLGDTTETVSSDIVAAGALLERLVAEGAANSSVPDSVRKLLAKARTEGAFPTAHSMRVAVEQCASEVRAPATAAALAAVASPLASTPDAEIDGALDAAFDAAFTPEAPRVALATEPPAPSAAALTPANGLTTSMSFPEAASTVPVARHELPGGLPTPTTPHVFALPPGPSSPAPSYAPVPPAADDAIAAPARLRALRQPAVRAAELSGEGGFWPSLRGRSFALLMACFVIANSGARMQTAGLTWLIFKRTNDPLFLGWFGLAFALPMVLLAPIGGILADRVERVRLLLVAKTLYVVLSIGLVVVNHGHHLGVGPILVAQALSSVLLAFEHPTRLSLVPDFVPRKHLQNALAVNGIVNYATVFAGPALAGWLLEPRGAAFVFILAGVSALLGIGLLTLIAPSPPRVSRREPLRELFFGGIKHVRGDRAVVAFLVLAAVVGVSARTYPELLPIFAQRTWGAGAKGYGLLASASGIGGTLSVIALSFAPNLRHKDAILLLSIAGLCASLVAFSLTRSLNTAAGILVLAGAFSTVFQNLGTNFVAARVPPAVLGRVLGLYTITLFGLPGFGMIVMTAVARASSGATALLVGVALSFVTLLATAYPVTRGRPPH